jgi:hypothetical protein
MSDEKVLLEIHPPGELASRPEQVSETVTSLDTFAGKVRVKWTREAAVSSLGLMPFFIEFLKTSGRFDEWVEQCPLQYASPNAPKKRDVLGTLLLAVLAGHWRYAHISAIRGDGVNPELLGMTRVASEDSVRRALSAIPESEGEQWLKQALKSTWEPLLEEPWVLDMDSTVKPLYGHQEDAKLGYNPSKPGRPSHVYHSYLLANLRVVLEVEVQAGNQTASSFAQPELWALVDQLAEPSRPAFLRGDCNWGTERAMQAAEERGMAYVFKLKQSAKVKQLLERLFGMGVWAEAGQQWQGLSTELRLSGWSRARRVIVLRRPLSQARQEAAERKRKKTATARQMNLDMEELTHGGMHYEYAVLVTSLQDEVRAVAQHYRDRGDSENNFDELKNQWAWAGFTTHDRKRCQLMARITALIYNWWTIFMRLGIPEKHAEAVTSRPLALHGIARRIRHGHQTTVEVTSTHARAGLMAQALHRVSRFLKRIKTTAEQLTQVARWRLILSAAFQAFLRGKILGRTARLAEPAG